MFSLKRMRVNFYSKWSWWLLLLTFALTFFSPDRGTAKNLYRLLVALPALLMLSGPVLKGFFAGNSMRWFAGVSLYFAASLFWSVEISSLDNHLLRILSVWGLFFLLYYLARFRSDLFLQIDAFIVLFGVAWVVFLLADWSSLWQVAPTFNRWEIRRGAFPHHLQVGWMLAVLSLLSLQRVFHKSSNRYIWVLLAVLFFTVLILAQARGGLLVFIAGVLTYLLIYSRRFSWRLVSIIIVGLFFVVGGIFILLPDLIISLVARGDALRFSIWQNWFSMWQETDIKMVFGYGLGASTENIVNGWFAATHFHNFYLNTIYYGGVVGFALTLGWFLSLAKQTYKEKALGAPWVPVVVGMLAGFLTDGDRLFNYPGAFTFCFLLPVFCLSFTASHLLGNEI